MESSRLQKDLWRTFGEVRDTLVNSMGHYQIWFTLRGSGKALENYYSDMNDYRYVDFFLASNTAHFNMMFIEIACLFDNSNDSYSIRNLKKLLRQEGLNDLANKFENHLTPYRELVSSIKTIRSKLVAHKNTRINEKELFDRHHVVPDRIKALLNELALLMEELEGVISGDSSTHSVGVTKKWEQATFNLLEVLRAGRNSK